MDITTLITIPSSTCTILCFHP